MPLQRPVFCPTFSREPAVCLLGETRMMRQRAIFVPRHGVDESVRSVRFVPVPSLERVPSATPSAGQLSSASTPTIPPAIEIWGGNYYGDPEGPMLASFSLAARSQFDFPEAAMPVVGR